jgi:hypothetical protein
VNPESSIAMKSMIVVNVMMRYADCNNSNPIAAVFQISLVSGVRFQVCKHRTNEN